MPLTDVILDWLEEGFLCFKGEPEESVRNHTSLIPIKRNAEGKNLRPRPLFPSFLDDIDLEPNFLIEYLETIERVLKKEKSRKEYPDPGEDTAKELSAKSSLTVEDQKGLSIEFERKSIFLSRMFFPIFDLPDCIVPNASANFDSVLERNRLYEKALEFHRNSPEHFCDQSTQVGYVEKVDNEAETSAIGKKDKQTIVNSIQIKEHYNEKETVRPPSPKTFKEYTDFKIKFCSYKEFLHKIPQYPNIRESFDNNLYVIEKMLNYNTYKNTLLSYNSYKLDNGDKISSHHSTFDELFSEDSGINLKISLKHHLQFHLGTLKNNYQVSCVESNSIKPNIFISGYGVLPSEEMIISPRGLVLCWNIHKCEYPERIYQTEEAVTCMEFSKTQPFLVAIGMRYGLIAVLDLRLPQVSSSHASNRQDNFRPIGSITGIRWSTKKYSLVKEMDILVAVSIDGIITCWNHNKELEGSVLRRIGHGDKDIKHTKHFLLATDAAGMCLQLNPRDQNTMLVGTVEGQVLQINLDEPEENSYVYNCHNGPTYHLQWSPLVDGVFVTCGTDRRLRIWECNREKPSKTILLKSVVLRLALSYMKSTLMAVMTKEKISIFDFSVHMHNPVVELKSRKETSFTSVAFCPKNNWLLIGGSEGVINLYELTNIPELDRSQADALLDIFLPEY